MFNISNIKIVGKDNMPAIDVVKGTAETIKVVDSIKKKTGYKNAKPAVKPLTESREDALNHLVEEVNKYKIKEDKDGNEYESTEFEHSKKECTELMREFITDYYINEKKKLKI